MKMLKRIIITIHIFWVCYFEYRRFFRGYDIKLKEKPKFVCLSFWVFYLEYKRRFDIFLVSYFEYKRRSDIKLKEKLKFVCRYPFRYFKKIIKISWHPFFNKTLVNNRSITVYYDKYRPVGTSLDGLVGLAWFCEKVGTSIQIKHPSRMIWRHFENNILVNTKDGSKSNFKSSSNFFLSPSVAWVGRFCVLSKYAYKILSQLSIKEDLRRSADEWFTKHIKGDWIAVHYRGTDLRADKESSKCRYRIDINPYITYLKEVLDDKCIIFACSDQQQFIDKMRDTFPGRVYARDIKRSYDDKPLHLYGVPHEEVDNYHQERDALIDLLILAKAKLIYTTGSGFVDVARYFNPKIRIVSLDERRIGRGENNIPIPKKDLLDKLSLPL